MVLRRFFCLMVLFIFVLISTWNMQLPNISANNVCSSIGFFTENKGQWDPTILFVGDTCFGKVAFTKEAVYYQMIQSTGTKEMEEKDRSYQSQVVRLSFVNPLQPTIQGFEVLSHYNNYFIGKDPSKWASFCSNYSKIEYRNVWKGIDLAYFFTPQGMKYEYYVSPEATIQDIQIKVDGAELTNQGNSLQLTSSIGVIQDKELKVFNQETGDLLNSHFAVNNNIITFKGIPEHRKDRIVIDPLIYSTYLGGIDQQKPFGDSATAIAVDIQGSVYITGATISQDFPIKNAYQAHLKYTADAFVTKLDPNGKIVYSTYLGGMDNQSSLGADLAYSIAVDTSGNAYITGLTDSTDFPYRNGFQSTLKGGRDSFVTKLNAGGSGILFSTYLGGTGSDYTYSLVLDLNNNVYVTGNTFSNDFPIKNALYANYHNDYGGDAFVTKISYVGKGRSYSAQIVYSTYLGGTNGDTGYAISVDKTGCVYIGGETRSQDFPLKNAFQGSKNGYDYDGFLTKLNASGNGLVYSTYLGGASDDKIFAVAVDKDNEAYVTGETKSFNFPAKNAYQIQYPGGIETFVTKFNATGRITFSTYLRGPGNGGESHGYGIVVDSGNNAYCCGSIWGDRLPIVSADQVNWNGILDAFVTKWDPSGKLLYSSYFGGSKNDEAKAITLDSKGRVIIAGKTSSPDLPTRSPAQSALKGSGDCFVTKIYLKP